VRAIAPHTEADPAAVLVQFLACFGNACGRGPGFQVEADRHHLNLFVTIVGETAKGRKGSSFGQARRPIESADENFAGRIRTGLSSGEGLIWEVRDPITKRRKARKTELETGEADEEGDVEVIEDEGVLDKRLVVYESELASVLGRMGRQGNNGNNPYSAYDLSGRSRGPAFSTRQFKRGWRRLALIVRGGPVDEIDAKLRRMGMPPVRTGAGELPRPKVALMWVPLSFGNPEIAKNHPRHWWPGGGYVDWVGTTWYSPYRATAAMDAMYDYRLWRRKPFAFAEWGVWGADAPGFVRQFFSFMRSHPRVRMAVYYQSAALKPEFRLSTHPATRAALRRAVRWRRLTGVTP
jgi:hypothetical protein